MRIAQTAQGFFLLLISALPGWGEVVQVLPADQQQISTLPQRQSKLGIPNGQAYAGAYIDFGDREDDVTLEKIEQFDRMVGKQQAIVAFSNDWGNQRFPSRQLGIIDRYGAMPLIYWSPWDRPMDNLTPRHQRGRFNLEAILAGQWDSYIDRWADQARGHGKPIFVSWGLEMNGDWFSWSGVYYGKDAPVDGCEKCYAGPETFKKAYRHIVDRVRARGAANILWVWHPNNSSAPYAHWNTMIQYYPGPDYADWLAISAYGMQFQGQGWVKFDDAISGAYRELAQVDPEKPLMLAEWGVGEFPKDGSKAQWIGEFFGRIPREFPRLRAAVFWHERWQNENLTISNLRVNSSADALQAYRRGIAENFWLDRPVWQSEEPDQFKAGGK